MGQSLKALVLAGGFSTRMGMDKGEIVYRNKAEKYRMADMLAKLGYETYISQRTDQEKKAGYRFIIDTTDAQGPMAGILSAFRFDPVAWFVTACDYPYLELKDIRMIMDARDAEADVSCVFDKESGYLLPTLACYESSIKEKIESAAESGDFALYKLLDKSRCHLIPLSGKTIQSVDGPREYQKTLRYFKSKKRRQGE